MDVLPTIEDSIKARRRKKAQAAALQSPLSPTSVATIYWERRTGSTTIEKNNKRDQSSSLHQSSSSSPPQKRSVSFNESVTILGEVPALSSLTEEDFSELWYSPSEYSIMEKASAFIAKLMNSKMVISQDDEELCTRGLETLSRRGARQRQQDVFDSIDRVLWEQDDQRARRGDSHSCGEEEIAKVYQEVTQRCASAAVELAKQDAEIARGS
jgi:hypothetical protein